MKQGVDLWVEFSSTKAPCNQLREPLSVIWPQQKAPHQNLHVIERNFLGTFLLPWSYKIEHTIAKYKGITFKK